MPYPRLNQQVESTSTLETGNRNSSEVLVNPLRYRSEIFTAVRVSHRDVITGRYVHFDVRRDEPRLPSETPRHYTDSGPKLDIDVMISKAGQRYRLQGTITDKKTCTTYSTLCFLKTIPARYSVSNPSIEAQPYQAPAWTEVRERLIGLQLQLDEIQREQTTLMRSPFTQSDATPAYHREPRYQDYSFTPYSPHPHPSEPQNNSSSY